MRGKLIVHLVLCFAIFLLPRLLCAETTILQNKSSQPEVNALDDRVNIERQTRFQKFVLTPHKQNYILPVTYNYTPNLSVIDPVIDGEISETEMKFQLSIKLPIAEQVFNTPATLYFAYTNLSFWQAYNSDASAPFRETNHEPEVFVAIPTGWQIAGLRNELVFAGFSHQSNGRSGAQSRSWNRFYTEFLFRKNDFYLSVKPWIRISDRADDNPDIEDYMGHAEVRTVYAKSNHTVSLMMRSKLGTDNKGAAELSWSFPLSRRAKGFFQYFNGYGESLIDYNAPVNRIGIGIALTDWL